MNTEDLLIKRYKVSDPSYPHCPFDPGQIIMQDMDTIGEVFVSIHEIARTNDRNWVAKEDVLNYPHLFKEISWWEDRQENEMPEYVKVYMFGVKKVKRHYKTICSFLGPDETGYSYEKSLPATEAEYLESKNISRECAGCGRHVNHCVCP